MSTTGQEGKPAPETGAGGQGSGAGDSEKPAGEEGMGNAEEGSGAGERGVDGRPPTPEDAAPNAEAEGRVHELETTAEQLRNQVGKLEGVVKEERARTAALRESLDLAVARYREALLAADPSLPAELVVGDSVEDLDRAAATAKGVVDKVRQQLATQEEQERVPAGAPGRLTLDVAALSPREKIKAGLARG